MLDNEKSELAKVNLRPARALCMCLPSNYLLAEYALGYIRHRGFGDGSD